MPMPRIITKEEVLAAIGQTDAFRTGKDILIALGLTPQDRNEISQVRFLLNGMVRSGDLVEISVAQVKNRAKHKN